MYKWVGLLDECDSPPFGTGPRVVMVTVGEGHNALTLQTRCYLPSGDRTGAHQRSSIKRSFWVQLTRHALLQLLNEVIEHADL